MKHHFLIDIIIKFLQNLRALIFNKIKRKTKFQFEITLTAHYVISKLQETFHGVNMCV